MGLTCWPPVSGDANLSDTTEMQASDATNDTTEMQASQNGTMAGEKVIITIQYKVSGSVVPLY